MWHPDIPTEYRNAIITGDARQLSERMPTESVDLIFTDPVYWQPQDYSWLAETALRILRPGGVALVWTGTTWERACLSALEEGGLQHNITLNYIVCGNSAFANSLNTFMWRSPCFWMSKGRTRKPRYWIPDTIVSGNKTANGFKWNKNPEAITTWLDAFTNFDSIVLDPFTGGGTVPTICKQIGRMWIAFEIDEGTAAKARERVETTQAMSPILLGEQVALDF